MKKLLVLFIVLGLATSAQAALTLSLSATTVAINGTVTLTVNSNVSGADGIWAGDCILGTDLVNWPTPVEAAWNDSIVTAGIGDQGYIQWESGYDNIVYKMNVAGTTVLPSAGDQFKISIKGVQAGTIYVDLQDISDYHEIANGPIALVVTPEPITMALLGLGGLFLRRRK